MINNFSVQQQFYVFFVIENVSQNMATYHILAQASYQPIIKKLRQDLAHIFKAEIFNTP